MFRLPFGGHGIPWKRLNIGPLDSKWERVMPSYIFYMKIIWYKKSHDMIFLTIQIIYCTIAITFCCLENIRKIYPFYNFRDNEIQRIVQSQYSYRERVVKTGCLQCLQVPQGQ